MKDYPDWQVVSDYLIQDGVMDEFEAFTFWSLVLVQTIGYSMRVKASDAIMMFSKEVPQAPHFETIDEVEFSINSLLEKGLIEKQNKKVIH